MHFTFNMVWFLRWYWFFNSITWKQKWIFGQLSNVPGHSGSVCNALLPIYADILCYLAKYVVLLHKYFWSDFEQSYWYSWITFWMFSIIGSKNPMTGNSWRSTIKIVLNQWLANKAQHPFPLPGYSSWAPSNRKY